MQKYFQQFGSIQETRVYFEELKNKCYKGYGFILFRTEQGMAAALKQGNSHTINEVTFECKQSLLKNELEQINKFVIEEDQSYVHKGKSKTSIDGKLSKSGSGVGSIHLAEEYVPKSKIPKGSGKKLNAKAQNFEFGPIEPSGLRKNQESNDDEGKDIKGNLGPGLTDQVIHRKTAMANRGKYEQNEDIDLIYEEDREHYDENDYMRGGQHYPGHQRQGPGGYGYQGQVPPSNYYSKYEGPYNYRAPPPQPRADYDPYYYPPSHNPYPQHQGPPPRYPPGPGPLNNESGVRFQEGYDNGKTFEEDRAYFARQQMQDSKKDFYYYEKTSSSSNKSGNYAQNYNFYNDGYQRHQPHPPHYHANSAPYWNHPPSQGNSVYYNNHPRANSHFMGQPGTGPLKGFQPQRKMVMKTLTEYKGNHQPALNPEKRGPRTEYPSSKPQAPQEKMPSREQLSTFARDTEELFNREKDNTMNIFDLEDNDGLSAIFDPTISSKNTKKSSEGVKHKTEGFNLQKMGYSESQIDKLEGELKPENQSHERRTEVVKSIARVDFDLGQSNNGKENPELVIEKPEEEERESEEHQSPKKEGTKKDIKFSDDEDYEERRREITCLDFGL